jgi:D-cysteine desulfhydrase
MLMKTPGKIQLAVIPTPLETITFQNKKFLMKRDDLTGSELSGNKVRKLEYLIAEALKEKADVVITCGGIQSNHARATTIAACRAGLKTKLYLWGSESSIPDGNHFLNIMYGADIEYLTKREYDNINAIMQDEGKYLSKKRKHAYIIPEGGSTTKGIYGYINFVNELKNQIDIDSINGIVVACGSGGTAAGIIAGLSYHKSDFKVYAVNVLYEEHEMRKKILNLAQAAILEFNLNCRLRNENLIVLDGYSREGYKSINKDKIKLIRSFAKETGILLDPAYTGKAFKAYNDRFLMRNKGMKNLFLHTGGIFGIFGRTDEYISS